MVTIKKGGVFSENAPAQGTTGNIRPAKPGAALEGYAGTPRRRRLTPAVFGIQMKAVVLPFQKLETELS